MQLNRVNLLFAAAALAIGASASRANAADDPILWASNTEAGQSPDTEACKEFNYHRPGRYGLDYACGKLRFHKASFNAFQLLTIAVLLVIIAGRFLVRRNRP